MGSTDIVDHSRDGESRFGEIVTLLVVFAVLSTTAVSLRVYARWYLLRSLGLDDAVIVVAQGLAIGTAVCEGLEARYGLGRHQWLFLAEDHVPYSQAFYASVVVYNVGLCLVKISILLQYRRIFQTPTMQRLLTVLLIVFGAWTIVLTFLLSLICVPVAKFWDPTVEGGRCLNELAIWYVVAGINLVTDFAVCGLPLPVINSLQLPRRQKFMLMAVFCLGLFTCIISIVRIPTLNVASKTQDATWDNVDAAVWSYLELTIGILTACLPTLRPVFVRVMPRLFGASTNEALSDRPSGAGRNSRFPYSGTSNTVGGSAWQRSKAAPSSSGKVLKDSDSTEQLDYGASWGPTRSDNDDDLEYGLEDLGRLANGIDANNYTVVVSAGGGDTPSEAGRQQEAVSRGGIKTTTLITQEVELDESDKRRSWGARKSSS